MSHYAAAPVTSALPQPTPSPARRGRLRPLESVAPRSAKRPTALYALLAVTTLFAVVAVQLLLSIAIAQGAFQVERLESQSAQLDRDLQIATGKLHNAAAPQNLATRAAEMGMVTSSVPVYLRLSDASIIGAPQGADAATTANLVPNSLLAGPPAGAAATKDSADAKDGKAAADTPAKSASDQTLGHHSRDLATRTTPVAPTTNTKSTSGTKTTESTTGVGVSNADAGGNLTPFTGQLPAPSTH